MVTPRNKKPLGLPGVFSLCFWALLWHACLLPSSVVHGIVSVKHCDEEVVFEADSPDPLYFFLGYDKTASTSIQAALEHLIPDEYVWGLEAGSKFCANLTVGEHPDVLFVWAMQGAFDLCAELNRPCKYFTVVRNPTSRVISAYNYFCRLCQENRRQCGHEGVGILTCPDMSLHEYANVFKNIYTASFAHPGQNIGWLYNATEEDFESAKAWITEHQPLILFTEDLAQPHPLKAIGDMLDRDILRNLARIPHANSREHGIKPSISHIKHLEAHYLYWDIALYNWMRTEYVQPDFSKRD